MKCNNGKGVNGSPRVCYVATVTDKAGDGRVRFGFDTRRHCQIEVSPARWEIIAARLHRAGYVLRERHNRRAIPRCPAAIGRSS